MKIAKMNKLQPITAEEVFALERQAFVQTQMDEFKEASRLSYSYMVERGFAPVYEQYADILNKRFIGNPAMPLTAQQLFDLEQRVLTNSPKFKNTPRRPFNDVADELQAMVNDINAYFLGKPVTPVMHPDDEARPEFVPSNAFSEYMGKPVTKETAKAGPVIEVEVKMELDNARLAEEIKAKLGKVIWFNPEKFDEWAREFVASYDVDGTEPIWMQRYKRIEKSRASEIVKDFAEFLKAKLTA